ncbi:unnamed protein product [Didymodactylos carnosus]|uniref:Uncharacterized protein n=1 Tax=Didymodactylos carnosus TaxID=1234261 RepID=A0A814Y760_9BILA|nr:unnamed protein product [Didymodactylos carnosus]CAF1226326.1 unnamed protein product [Didymodactylos carnosus]CAF3845098.1 unnamed protein product [Didymodactylos carnosus]CAF3989252.1 unnamed protein product [Didymodactylos carnosus]
MTMGYQCGKFQVKIRKSDFARNPSSIAEIVLDEDQLQYVSWDAFFTHILLHEVAHSNGPHSTIGPNSTTVREQLQQYHSAIEEAKADITGLFAAHYFVQKGQILHISLENFYVTFLAGGFRSIRFGLEDSHGRGQALQLNYLIDQKGFEYNSQTQRFRVNFEHITQAVKNLTTHILKLQGDGNKELAQESLDRWGNTRDYTKIILNKLKTIPVDVSPIFSAVEYLQDNMG